MSVTFASLRCFNSLCAELRTCPFPRSWALNGVQVEVSGDQTAETCSTWPWRNSRRNLAPRPPDVLQVLAEAWTTDRFALRRKESLFPAEINYGIRFSQVLTSSQVLASVFLRFAHSPVSPARPQTVDTWKWSLKTLAVPELAECMFLNRADSAVNHHMLNIGSYYTWEAPLGAKENNMGFFVCLSVAKRSRSFSSESFRRNSAAPWSCGHEG